MLLGRGETGRVFLERAVELEPAYAQGHYFLAIFQLAEGEFEPFLRPISGEVKKFHVGQLIRNGNLLRNVAHAQFTREDLAAWLARDIEQFMRGEEPLRAESA